MGPTRPRQVGAVLPRRWKAPGGECRRQCARWLRSWRWCRPAPASPRRSVTGCPDVWARIGHQQTSTVNRASRGVRPPHKPDSRQRRTGRFQGSPLAPDLEAKPGRGHRTEQHGPGTGREKTSGPGFHTPRSDLEKPVSRRTPGADGSESAKAPPRRPLTCQGRVRAPEPTAVPSPRRQTAEPAYCLPARGQCASDPPFRSGSGRL